MLLTLPGENGEGRFTQGEKVARLFFLNQTENNPLPIRPVVEGLLLTCIFVNFKFSIILQMGPHHHGLMVDR